ncbi:hypothetical protein DVK02_12875 [Halobellus sp. Atlit-31R]|nr:hypothetical protein DVK02_12875 [Halobellus sp. Atlit-31R]
MVDISEYLSGSVQLDGVDFRGATGANWGQIGVAIVTSMVTTLFVGVTSVVQSITDAIAWVIAAAGEFFGSTPAVWVGRIADAAAGAGTGSLGDYGIAAVAVAIAGVLGSYYLTALLLRRVV